VRPVRHATEMPFFRTAGRRGGLFLVFWFFFGKEREMREQSVLVVACVLLTGGRLYCSGV
jgi:hypothetical protein